MQDVMDGCRGNLLVSKVPSVDVHSRSDESPRAHFDQKHQHVSTADICEEAARYNFQAVLVSTVRLLIIFAELQVQYSNYKETLQAIAQKIGDVEQETEEHK